MARESTSESTVIGQGIHVQGEITGSAPIEVWGTVDGQADTEGVFWVRDGGKVSGEITAQTVVIEGSIDGKVSAREKIELRASCKVEGDITAATVAIAEGSHFEGRVQMGGKK